MINKIFITNFFVNKYYFFTLTAIITFIVRNFAPERFFGDEKTFFYNIQNFPYELTSPEVFLVFIYRIVTVNSILPTIFYILLLNYFLLSYIFKILKNKINVLQIIALLPCTFFLSFVNKDIYTVMVCLYLVFSKHALLFRVILYSVFALLVSRYYLLLTLINFLFLRISNVKKISYIFFFLLINTISIYLVLKYFYDFNIFKIRETLNNIIALNIEREINTTIINTNFFANGVLNDILNYCITLTSLAWFPIIYAKKITFTIFIAYVLTFFTFLSLISKSKFIKINKEIKKIYYFIFSYYFVIAIFEPDLGSFLRHFTVIFIFYTIFHDHLKQRLL
jgi:hypothetical protein